MKRLSNQPQVPLVKKKQDSAVYDIFPAFELGSEKIHAGYESLFEKLESSKNIILDGYIGVDWDEVSSAIKTNFSVKNKAVNLINCADYYKPSSEILQMVAPYLGGDDPVFGKKTDLDLSDFFTSSFTLDIDKASEVTTVVYGCGASLSGLDGILVYFDLPKNELQYRMRAGSVTNLATDEIKDPKQAYKHFFFVDWVVCNKEKKRLLPQVDFIVDQQRSNNPAWMSGVVLRTGLDAMSETYFRVRPWFEPGVWGGQWLAKNIPDLPKNEPNYAWSFEMIVPENGLIFSSSGILLEVSFDWLMYRAGEKVLGKAYERFGDDFPIRFDFLDTFDGDNLSVQCHPSTAYAKEHFGENFTQDETYYIMETTPESHVYLGFQENINPHEFREELENSIATKSTIDVERFVQKLPSEKHGLYLIPNGTIHCSGTDNLVLEISATPYIYTFKIYDWQRLDLNGEPRPLNVGRAFENLDFSKKGQVVQETLISRPEVVEAGEDWEKILLQTHPDHFYEVIRYEFDSEVIIPTGGQCHLLMLVEGESLELDISIDCNTKFHFAETFAIPAATGSYRLKNLGSKRAKVVISYVKDLEC
ncbi:class I mannose-6-phosphate isomerase [Echinicola sp. CAU 1574]|uniref:Class I mannose-6-phosphate isomerase n=1 Tax=Echinicola arenosa TaxID=2774144 RepID=A0ABR9AHE9_9BACT|nr:class I mannose-6-phosphate isomerase [Echinicola arenosa]MBD8488140.1 class I mannose-6-phosphate isomerase [Echinicola arenosa]